MDQLRGIGVSPGRVIGPVLRMPAAVSEPPAGGTFSPDTSAEQEVQLLRTAADTVRRHLERRAAYSSEEAAAILRTTALLAVDPKLLASASESVRRWRMSAERALWEAAGAAADTLTKLNGPMADRAVDILDVRARLVAELRGLPAPGVPTSRRPFVLTAQDLAPADAAILDPALVLGIVTEAGGGQSHTAILARHLGLPAVVGAAGIKLVQPGTPVYLDGTSGEVRLHPGEPHRAAVDQAKLRRETTPEFDGTGTMADGYRVPLLANVGGPADAAEAARAGAEGIGLLRTEFCFPGRGTEPSVEEQRRRYREVFEHFAGKEVVVRTLDGGSDKPLTFLGSGVEPNPALGMRGIRTDVTAPGVLTRQLQAIAAAADGSGAKVRVMAPMIATAAEAAGFAALCRAAGLATPGVMVEVPAAALSARAILGCVDFASVGTNDLTQYTMAADRRLGSLAGLNDPWQPAVLELIRLTVAGAGGKPVGVCGEAAADPALAVVLVGLGVTNLSMTARALPSVAAALRTVSLGQAQSLAHAALTASDAEAAKSGTRRALDDP